MEEPNVVLAQHICCTGGCMRKIEGNLKFLPFPILDYLLEQGQYAQFCPQIHNIKTIVSVAVFNIQKIVSQFSHCAPISENLCIVVWNLRNTQE
jgi:hypothetical protein